MPESPRGIFRRCMGFWRLRRKRDRGGQFWEELAGEPLCLCQVIVQNGVVAGLLCSTWVLWKGSPADSMFGWVGGGGGGGGADSKNNQTTPATTSTSSIRQLLGAADAQTAHPATFSTAPAHQQLGSANAETTPAGAPAAAADRTQRPDATCEGECG